MKKIRYVILCMVRCSPTRQNIGSVPLDAVKELPTFDLDSATQQLSCHLPLPDPFGNRVSGHSG